MGEARSYSQVKPSCVDIRYRSVGRDARILTIQKKPINDDRDFSLDVPLYSLSSLTFKLTTVK